jgi:predicted PhzF superfamily epimerase YddE/YHI9
MADTKKQWFFNCTSETSGATNTHIKSFRGMTNGISEDYSTASTNGALYQTLTDSYSHHTKVANIVC